MSTHTVGADDLGLTTAAIVRDIWDTVSETEHEPGIRRAAGVQGQAWTALLSRLLPPTRPLSILDVGCGSGSLAFSLAALGHTVTGLDLSPGMLHRCRIEAERRGVEGLRLVEGSAEQPPHGLGPFDVVISRDLLWLLPHPENALNAWFGLLRPGGRVLGIDTLRPDELVGVAAGRQYPADVLDALPLLHARDLDPIENLWRRAGLEDVMVEELRWIDAVVHSDVPVHVRPMVRRLRHYLVEGVRPAPGEESR